MEPCLEKQEFLKKEEEQEHEGNNSNLYQFDLNLTTNDQELNLIDCFNKDSSENPPTDGDQRVFSCNYCQRKFYSSQALGGHQNAHKRERILAKRGSKIAAFGYHFYSTMASLPLHARSLGIQAHSTIHKPTTHISSINGSRNMYGYGGWTRPLIDQQPAVGKLLMENYHVNATAALPVTPPRDGVGRFNLEKSIIMGSSARLGFGDSYCHFKGSQDELQNLDLSLKL
ncbi:zinc finger protein 1-like [Mercurialis annua]|uniref:zinc finger protein 1-like n=1 Tax=Mercurialis annua TaxID=3986 RepID=UPI0021607A1A|nr:zinc finger protein 1-like [Mercurialis annua]